MHPLAYLPPWLGQIIAPLANVCHSDPLQGTLPHLLLPLWPTVWDFHITLRYGQGVELWEATWKGLFTMNTSPKVKQWINSTTLKFWGDWNYQHVARGQRNRYLAHEPCIHRSGFSRKSQNSCDSATTLHLWHGSVLLTAVLQLKTVLKGKRFKGIDMTKENMTKHLRSNKLFKKCFQQW